MATIIDSNLGNMLYRGKVRDTYDLGEGRLLMVATDRISAFDVVLPNGVPDKGVILSRLSDFWFQRTQHLLPNHMIALADDAQALSKLPYHPLISTLDDEIAKRSVIVTRAERIDVECIVRGYLTGSAWAEYKKNQTVFWQKMPAGLSEGYKFEEPLFTPTTKADQGHDENMQISDMESLVGTEMTAKLKDKTIELYNFAHDFAYERGLILADTKIEFGTVDGNLIVIDELLTPDSSRYWDANLYELGKSPPNFDKQFVRDWLNKTDWNKEPPAPSLPEDILTSTRERYLEAQKRLTGTVSL